MKKKLLALLLAVLMLVSLMPVTALADGELTIELADGPFIYCADQIKPEIISVTDDGGNSYGPSDYTVNYGTNTDAGEEAGSVTVSLKSPNSGTGTVYFDIAQRAFDAAPEATVTVPGDRILSSEEDITVEIDGRTLVMGTDYEVTLWFDDENHPATCYAQIDGKGNYTGTAWADDFDSIIVPKLEYTGKAQTCVADNAYYTFTDNTKTDAGEYTAKVTPTEGNKWADGTTVAKDLKWSIAKAPLTVTVDPATIIYGDPLPAFTVSYSGFVNEEDASVLGGTLSFECDYCPGDGMGAYDVTAQGLTSDNYEITFKTTSALTVNNAEVTVTAPTFNYPIDALDGLDQYIDEHIVIDGVYEGDKGSVEFTYKWYIVDYNGTPEVGESYDIVFPTYDDDGKYGDIDYDTYHEYNSSGNNPDNYNVTRVPGKVTFEEIPATAQIGEKKYETLAAAIDDAKDNDTILILANQEVAKLETGNRSLTIKPAGDDVTLTLTGPMLLGDVNGGKMFTLTGGADGETLTIQPKAGENNFRLIAIRSGNTLTMLNGVTLTGNTLTGAPGAAVNVAENATFEMKGGTIQKCKACAGGAINVVGTFNMSGGTIENCEAVLGTSTEDADDDTSGRGGALMVTIYGTVNMTGGTIENCKAAVAGGAIYSHNEVDVSDGAQITGCSVDGRTNGDTVKAKGGAVYLYQGSFTMTGGEISGNTLNDVEDMRGAGVYAASDVTVTLGGTAKITGNTDGKGNKSNLFLYDGVTLALGTKGNAPQNGMSVGVNTKTPADDGVPVEISKACDNYSAYFVADRTGEKVVYADGILKLMYSPVVCEFDRPVALSENTFNLYLGGKDMGEYTFKKSGNGWTVYNVEKGKFAAWENEKLIWSDTGFEWKYSGGVFSTTQTNRNSWGLSGFWNSIGTLFGVGKTMTYYLVNDGGHIAISRLTNGAAAVFMKHHEDSEHAFGDWIDCKDGKQHMRVCLNCGEVETHEHEYVGADYKCVCGAYEPGTSTVDVTATYNTKTQRQYVGWWPFGYYKNVTTYTATVKAETVGPKVIKIEVAASEKGPWTLSSTYTSNAEIGQFYVRVTTSDGVTRQYMVKNGIGYPAN